MDARVKKQQFKSLISVDISADMLQKVTKSDEFVGEIPEKRKSGKLIRLISYISCNLWAVSNSMLTYVFCQILA